MSIKTICKSLFCFNCTKPEECKLTILPESKIDLPSTPVEQPKNDFIFRAFRFKYIIKHIESRGEKDVVTAVSWTSNLYFDYKEAVEKSRKIVKDITDEVNAHIAGHGRNFLFHLDFSVKFENILQISAMDVQLVTFRNGKLIGEENVLICDGDNIVLQKPENLHFLDIK